MTSQVRTALLSFILTLNAILTVTPYADADGDCFQGTYFVRESSGTQSLWTFSQDGTYQSASSAEAARSFGHIQGAWEKTRDRELRSTGLAFTFSGGNGDVGVPPLRTARVDAAMSFTHKCEEMEGTFEVRFFDPDDDPLSEPGEFVFSDTFTGRRVTVN
jgi:hypothetical protein